MEHKKSLDTRYGISEVMAHLIQSISSNKTLNMEIRSNRETDMEHKTPDMEHQTSQVTKYRAYKITR